MVALVGAPMSVSQASDLERAAIRRGYEAIMNNIKEIQALTRAINKTSAIVFDFNVLQEPRTLGEVAAFEIFGTTYPRRRRGWLGHRCL